MLSMYPACFDKKSHHQHLLTLFSLVNFLLNHRATVNDRASLFNELIIKLLHQQPALHNFSKNPVLFSSSPIVLPGYQIHLLEYAR